MRPTAEQQAAVHAAGRRVLVVAGPGTGKTTVLAMRAVWLLETGRVTPPEQQVLALAFTRYAARQLADRVAGLAAGAGLAVTSSAARFTTIHAACLGMIRQWPDRCGLLPAAAGVPVTVCGTAERELMLAAAADRCAVRRPPPRRAMARLIREYERRGTLERSQYPRECLSVWDAYQRMLAASNAVDFATIVAKATELLARCQDAADYYRHRWPHVLLDEAQDLNPAQFRWLAALRPGTLFAVGDPDQSIYGWRGTSPDLFYALERI